MSRSLSSGAHSPDPMAHPGDSSMQAIGCRLQETGEAFCFQGSLKFLISTSIGRKSLIPDGRPALVINDLKRPSIATDAHSVDFHAHGNPIAGDRTRKGRTLYVWIVVIGHGHPSRGSRH